MKVKSRHTFFYTFVLLMSYVLNAFSATRCYKRRQNKVEVEGFCLNMSFITIRFLNT